MLKLSISRRKKMKIYEVWIHGFPLTDYLMTLDQAIKSFQWYRAEGYKDVKIIDTTTM